MGRMTWVLLLVAFAWVQAADRPAWAQESSPAVRMDLTLSRRPPVPPQPLPDPMVVEKDALEAIAAIKARERSEELVRELMQSRLRRPDLDRDVWSGIESRNVNNALRRR